jgi:hypothetical protein
MRELLHDRHFKWPFAESLEAIENSHGKKALKRSRTIDERDANGLSNRPIYIKKGQAAAPDFRQDHSAELHQLPDQDCVAEWRVDLYAVAFRVASLAAFVRAGVFPMDILGMSQTSVVIFM